MFELLLATEEQIRSYITEERIKRGNTLGMDICYLVHDSESFKLTLIYFILLDNEICGFCLIPSYQPDILIRIYVSPEHRRKGLGSFVLQSLGIKKLNCLAENDVGLAFYRNNGFSTSYAWNNNPHAFTFTKD